MLYHKITWSIYLLRTDKFIISLSYLMFYNDDDDVIIITNYNNNNNNNNNGFQDSNSKPFVMKTLVSHVHERRIKK